VCSSGYKVLAGGALLEVKPDLATIPAPVTPPVEGATAAAAPTQPGLALQLVESHLLCTSSHAEMAKAALTCTMCSCATPLFNAKPLLSMASRLPSTEFQAQAYVPLREQQNQGLPSTICSCHEALIRTFSTLMHNLSFGIQYCMLRACKSIKRHGPFNDASSAAGSGDLRHCRARRCS
jgi:hypothetical protein